MERIAVVLMNLGGPDCPEAVQPFLFNLFNDRAIIRLPNPLRWLIARLISSRRTPEAQEIYHHLGGRSPLLPNTQAQAGALEKGLKEAFPQDEVKVFIAMRYWHPLTEETVERVKDFKPTQVLLLPLYPHFSTTTTQSSVKEWHNWAQKKGLSVVTRSLCCYPTYSPYIKSLGALLKDHLNQAPSQKFRILFSAHGLPKRVVAGGDPYQSQIEKTAAAVMNDLSDSDQRWDWQVCYQSRVGPLEWIGPPTEEEILRAGKEGLGIIVVPIAFVSEHSETLVELDIQYRELAQKSGAPFYLRVPTPMTHPLFIQSLVDLTCRIRYSSTHMCAQDDRFRCEPQFHQCPRN